MKVAVVGAGIAGLAATYLLSKAHDVTLFEAEGRLGGHAHTHRVAGGDGTWPIDTGFIMANIDELKNTGLKATLPRLKILDLFQTADVRHLTAEDVYRLLMCEGMDIGLSLVSRVPSGSN